MGGTGGVLSGIREGVLAVVWWFGGNCVGIEWELCGNGCGTGHAGLETPDVLRVYLGLGECG